MGTFKKLFASIAAVMIVVSTVPVAVFGQTSRSTEYQDAYAYAFANGITTMPSINSARLADTTTRAEFAKMASAYAENVLGRTPNTSAPCSFSDLAPVAGTDLADYAVKACQLGLMGIGTNGIFNPMGVLSRAEAFTVISRMFYGDKYNGGNPYYAAHMDALQKAGLINDLSNPTRPIIRGDVMLVLKRSSEADLSETPGSCSDVETVFACTIDPDGSMGLCPAACVSGSTPTPSDSDSGEVKAGSLNLSLGAGTPANGASIPNNGVVSFAEVKFAAGSSDVRVNSVTLTRQGLGDRSDISRVYFERNGVRVSSRGSLTSDGVVTVSFSPALVVKAGSSESLDLVVSLSGAQAGSEHRFAFTDVNSSAASALFNISTPTLRTTTYTVGSLAFTRVGTTGSIQGSETDFEIGRFKLDNTSSNDKQVKVKAITFRNAGNGSLANGLSDISLYKNSDKVSTDVIINGREITFVVNTVLAASENALFYIRANAAAVENEAGDTYRFELRNAEDVNATELNTNFRVSLPGFTGTVTSSTYTVNGGDVQIARDTSVPLSSTVSSSSTNVILAKGTISAKKAVTLEDLKFGLTVNGGALTGVVQRLTLRIGNQTSTFTPAPSDTSPLNNKKFDGTFNVNGNVSFQITADLRSSFTGTATVQLDTVELGDFESIEYVSNGNQVASDQLIGSVSTVNVNVQGSTLNASRNDGLTARQVVAGVNDLTVLGVRLSTSSSSSVTVNSLTLAPIVANPTTGLNNKLTLSLYVNGQAKGTKQYNGNPVSFSSLNETVANGSPLDLVVKANISSSTTANTTLILQLTGVNATSNSQTVASPAAVSGVQFTIVSAGSANVSANTSNTDQGFAAAMTTKKVGSFSVQAITDDVEVRGAYLEIEGLNAYTQAGNVLSNFVIKNASGVVVASESARSGANNEFVKFSTFTPNTKVNAGTTSTYSVEATVGQLNGSGDAGEFRVRIATGFTDSAYSGQIYSGMRLYSVAAGNYINAGTVTSSAIGNTLSIVSAYPLVTKVADGNATDLLTFKITNQGTATLYLSGVQYFANAQSGGDLSGKSFTIFNGPTIVAQGSLQVGSNTPIGLNSVISIAPGADLVLTVKLDQPFVNTANNPQAGQRVFQISNVFTAQQFADGSLSTYAGVLAGYLTAAGLPVTAANY